MRCRLEQSIITRGKQLTDASVAEIIRLLYSIRGPKGSTGTGNDRETRERIYRSHNLR